MGVYQYGSYQAPQGHNTPQGYSSTQGYNTPQGLPSVSGYQDELWAGETCREAISALERALTASPLKLARETSAAARTIGKLQEKVTEWQRLDRTNRVAGQWDKVLERLNQAHTLITSVEYPLHGVRRKPIEQAKSLLQSILVDELF